MQLTSILALSVLALGVTASPHVVRNNPPSCQGGMSYNWGKQSCECPPQQHWDGGKNKCCYEPMPEPQCPPEQSCYCSKDKDNYCEYDQNNDWCQNDGWNSVWCCDPRNPGGCMNSWYPPTPPQCPSGQEWCGEQKQCKCHDGMYWDDGQKDCRWNPIPEPWCPPLMQPWCGKSESEKCEYDANNDWCGDDGTCWTWCQLAILG